MTKDLQTTTICVEINGRYFRKYSKGRCLTAWTIAGAKHFLITDLDRAFAIIEAETRKGKKCRLFYMGPLPEYKPDSTLFAYEDKFNAKTH